MTRVRPLARRAATIGALVAFAIVCAAPAAVAHNGVGAAFKGRAGPYIVYAYDGDVLANGRLQYRLILLDRRSGGPADDVRVRITATKPGSAPTTTTASVYNNVVFYELPDPYPATWLVHVRLDGKLGHGDVEFHMHGYPGGTSGSPTAAATVTPTSARSDSSPVAAIAIGSASAAAIVAIAAYLWRRRASRARR